MIVSKLENSLYQALENPNNTAQLEKIKDKAKAKLNGHSVSAQNRALYLNIINVVNEVLMNQKVESGQDQGGKYQAMLNVSQQHISCATEKVDASSQDTFAKKVNSLSTENLALDEAKLLNELGLFGSLHLTQGIQNQERMQCFLDTEMKEAKLLETTGDGNCFYRAVSTANYYADYNTNNIVDSKITEKDHVELRKMTAEHHTRAGRVNLAKKHAEPKTWATDAEIRALVAAEGKPILVLKYDPTIDDVTRTIYAPAQEHNPQKYTPFEARDLRVIANIDNVHFNAVHTTINERRQILLRDDFVNITPVL